MVSWLPRWRAAGRDLLLLRVPGDAGQLFLAGLPLGAGEHARGYVDQAGREFEDASGGPWAAVARTILPGVVGVRHARGRDVLDGHFREGVEGLPFSGIVFQMVAGGG